MFFSWCRTMHLAPARLPLTPGFWNDGNKPTRSSTRFLSHFHGSGWFVANPEVIRREYAA
jgi:hypothetical protein